MKNFLFSATNSRAHLALLTSIGVALGVSSQPQIRTFTLKTANDIETISFDPSKVSEHQLSQLVLLSPFVISYINDTPARDFSAAGSKTWSKTGDVVDKRFLAKPLELCITAAPAYSNCDRNDIGTATFSNNAKVNLDRSRRGLLWLQHLDYPKELQHVVKYLEKSLEISLWTEETRFKYYSTWDASVLKQVHEGIDPGRSCPDIFPRLEAAASNKEKYQIVRFDWANCIIRGTNQKLGRYPIGAWNAFLKAYGIKEEYKELGPD